MSLEEELQTTRVAVENLTEVVIKLTAAMSGATTVAKAAAASGSANETSSTDTAKPRGRPKKDAAAAAPAPAGDDFGADDDGDEFGDTAKTYTRDEVRAKIYAVKDNVSKEAAKAIFIKHAPKIDDIPEAKFAEVVAECEKALAKK